MSVNQLEFQGMVVWIVAISVIDDDVQNMLSVHFDTNMLKRS